MRLPLAVLIGVATLCGAPVFAQQQLDFGQGVGVEAEARSVLVIDADRLFAESAFGKRVAAEVDAAARALAAENTALSTELDAEEKALTVERDKLSIQEFSAKADTFDEKVKRIRAEQLTKERELTDLRQKGETRFRELARPVLRAIMDRYNAAVLMDLRAILIALDTADVTDEAIAEINARIGDGSMAESGQQQ